MNQVREKKQIILEIATRIFSRYGYNKTSLDEIAAEARIAKGTIYYYFPSKEELFISVVRAQANSFVDEMRRKLSQEKGFEEKLRYFIQAPVKYVCEEMPIWLDGLKSIPFNFSQHFDEFRRHNRTKMLELMLEILREGIAEGVVSDIIPEERLSEVINDWFMLGNLSVVVVDFDDLLRRLEQDHEVIMNMIMYGIIKRG